MTLPSKPSRRRGRPPLLSIEMILHTALEKTRSVGLDRFSMKELATSLGVGEMSIYHHVPTRFDLDQLIVQQIAEGVALPKLPDEGAEREWLETVARQMRDTLDDYPGAAQHLLVHGPSGPMLPAMQEILSVLVQYGVDHTRLVRAYGVFTTTIVALSVQRTAIARHASNQPPFQALRDELRSGPPAIAALADDFGTDIDGFFDDAVGVVLDGLVAS